MNESYDAIVVGGGIAGLTSAAYLTRSGARTLLIEKREQTGGLVNTFHHQGFAFDAGIRAFENSGILFPMLKNLGIDLALCTNPVSIGIGEQWICLGDREDLQQYGRLLTSVFPQNAADIVQICREIRKVMGYMDVLYGIDNPIFLENMHDTEYLVKTLLPWLMQYRINIRKAGRLCLPVHTHLRQFTQNDALIDMIAQHFFQDTPAFFALSYFGLYLDYRYPMGGTGVLAEKLTSYIAGQGGRIQTAAFVKRIDCKNNQLLLSNGQTPRYQTLIWAANQKTLYANMTGANTLSLKKQRSLVEQCTGGDSVLTLFLGVNWESERFFRLCGAHAFYTPHTNGLSSLPPWRDAAKNGLPALLEWLGLYLESTTYELSCPALRDPSLAPPGATGLIVSTLMEYDLVRCFYDLGEYRTFKKYCTSAIVRILHQTQFAGLQDSLRFALCATPLTIERITGNAQGAITGWSFCSGKLPSEHRFPKITRSIQTPVRNILQCGQWTFSPSGLPVSILTGKLAADAACRRKGDALCYGALLN